MAKIEAVIFDLEGVIVNSEPHWTQADLIFLHSHNVDISFEEYEEGIKPQLMGLVLKDGILFMKKHFSLPKEPDDLAKERRAGMRSIALTTSSPKERLVNADLIVDSYLEIDLSHF